MMITISKKLVLNTLIQSQGLICPLPLSSHNAHDFSSELHYRDSEPRGLKSESDVQLVSRARQKAHIKAQQQYQNRLAQAEITLAFITPSEFKSWYFRFNRDGIEDYDLIELLMNWMQCFKNMNLRKQINFVQLWSALLDFYDEIDNRLYGERLLDGYALPNKIIGLKGV